MNGKEEHVIIEAVYRMPPEELGAVSKPGQGLAGLVYKTCAPVLLDRYADIDAPLLKGMDDDIVVGMPIMWRGDIIGTFGIGASPPKRFGDNDLRTLEVFARHAAIAINNARSYEREKKYSALKERQRLARELHDSVSQLLFSMTLVAQSIGPGFDKDRKEGEARIARILEIAQLAQEEMKALLNELKSTDEPGRASMAAYARHFGLARALRRHCEMTLPDSVKAEIKIDEQTHLDGTSLETLMRIAQEALANALRHGRASHLRLELCSDSKNAVFTIDDDGAGFEHPASRGNVTTRIGVQSMRERAGAIGGRLTVTDRAPHGVRVEVRLPLQ